MARGLALATVLGAIWGFVTATVAGISATLVFGVNTDMTSSAAMIAGIPAAVGHQLARDFGFGGRSSFIAAMVIFTAVLCALTGFAPLGLSLIDAPITSGATVSTLAALTIGVIAISFHGKDWRSLNRYRIEEVVGRTLKGLGFVFFGSIVLLPFYAMLMTSFKKQAELLTDPLDYSINLTQGFAALFSSYIELFTTFDFGRFILVSTLVSVSTVFITLAASIPGAYAISRLRFPGRVTFSRSILLIYMVPAIVLVIPLYAVFSQLGLRDSLLGLLIVYPATTIPVSLYMLQGYFRGLPSELEEAGLVDGCSRLMVIWRITLPLSLPAIASVALYVFMIAWNEFLFAFMFIDSPEIFTLSRAVVSLNSSEVPRQHLMAGAVIVTIPVLVIFLWFERFLVQGLAAGGVKG
ncbi:MAG: carbohydrate ABC transporter permease [Roseovarius sp.]|nr:carbohydrate ABC transporter permease [Roseovarius sp.]